MDFNNSELIIKDEVIEDQEMNNSGTSKYCVEGLSLNEILLKANIPSHRNHVIKSKILSGEYKISMKKKRSKVWECFARILDENDEDILDFVICRKCQNVYKYFHKSTSNLVRHKCVIKYTSSDNSSVEKVDVSADTKTEALQIFSQWIIENGKPFKIVEDFGFQKVVEFLISVGAEYGKNVNFEEIVPRPTKLCTNIEELYETYFKCVKTEIQDIATGFALTSGICKDKHLKRTHLALTIHYVQDGNIVERLLALKSIEEHNNSGEIILNKIREILKDFGCNLTGNVTIVTDQTTNLINAFHKHKHIICISQLLKNVLQKAMDDDGDVVKLHGSCTKLVEYLINSNFRASFCSTFERSTLIQGHDFYYLITEIKENWTEIVQFLRERNNFGILSDISIAHVHAMIKILQLFEEASKKLEAENEATIHFSYVYVHRLQKLCMEESNDSILIAMFKKKLSENLESIVISNISIFHKIALFLFPPTKKLILFSEHEKDTIKKECKNIMRSYKENSSEVCNQKSSTATISKKNFELFADFVQERKIPCIEDKAEKEIFQYESKDIPFFDDFNVVKWWESQKEEFPLLYKLSCMVLATPATSAASEKVLLIAKNLISENRCQLSFENGSISKVMFLNSNMEKFE